MTTYKNSLSIIALLIATSWFSNAAAANEIRSIENMERERSLMVGAFMNEDMLVEERARKITNSQRRLVDLERIALRDDKLTGSRSVVVKRAFNNYDLSFLVHASAEHQRLLVDHWLEHMGVSTASVRATRVGRRQ